MKTLILIIGIMLVSQFAIAEPVYTETESYQIEILEDGHLQVRKATKVFKDGIEIAKTYHRHVLAPGDDTTKEIKKVKDVAMLIWTPYVVNEYKIKMEKSTEKLTEKVVEPVK